ncbi:MAG: carboxypeptidase-like regulatory domain-containing protein [Bacteroidota bacterium]
MKSVKTGLIALAVATTGFLGFKSMAGASIKGSVTPAENAVAVRAISGTDTLKATVDSGKFELFAPKAGTYTIQIEATAPYKTTVKEGVVVNDDQPVDLGEITLEKQ